MCEHQPRAPSFSHDSADSAHELLQLLEVILATLEALVVCVRNQFLMRRRHLHFHRLHGQFFLRFRASDLGLQLVDAILLLLDGSQQGSLAI